MVVFVRWRSMPRELVVPVLIATILSFASPFLLLSATLPFILPIGRVKSVLVLCALLELRRRLPAPSARWIAVAIAVQVLVVATFVLLDFSGWLDIEDVARWVAVPASSTVLAIGLAVALIGAARAWRSPLGAIAIVTAALSHPLLLMSWMREEIGRASC